MLYSGGADVLEKYIETMTGERFKSSFQTALAMTMAYGFALWFDWDRPMWAAFAVALISLPTLEESLAKGGQRLRGTLLAIPVSLSFIALFSQDRWLFMICLSSWLAFCTYRMSSGKNSYLWFCAGFVSAIVATNGGPDPVNAFSIAVIRTLETALGIACYAVVAAFLWPVKAEAAATAPDEKALDIFPDVDRLQQALRVFATYWIGFLLVIYVPTFPGGIGFMGMLAPFAIILASTPQLPARALFPPVVFCILLASPIYMLLMPQLSGFTQLAVVIFGVSFLICYRYHEPQQALGRSFGLCFFAVVTDISNEQSYSFLAVANTTLMFSVMLLLLALTASIPVSNQPEKAFLRLLLRYLKAANYLSGDQRQGIPGQYLRRFYEYELRTLPAKLQTWRERMPPTVSASLEQELAELMECINQLPLPASDDFAPAQNGLDRITSICATIDFSSFKQARF